MRKDELVAVYYDPYTQEDLEGYAELKRFVRSDVENCFEWWNVEFDDEPDELYERMIKTNIA